MITTPDTPMRKVEHMKGLKIRIPLSRISNEVFSAWSGIPTPMPFTEIFMALRQNVVNGQDNGWNFVIGQQFYTVQKYAMATDHGMAGALLQMNQTKCGSLTPEQRKRLDDLPKEV